MKVLIDTNVLISAILRDKDPQAVILWVLNEPEWEWIVSRDILKEYKEVLNRKKFALPTNILHRWEEFIDHNTVFVRVSKKVEFSRDRKDAKFLSCALASRVDFFITGDRDFEEAYKLVSTTILSVSMFKRLVMDDRDI